MIIMALVIAICAIVMALAMRSFMSFASRIPTSSRMITSGCNDYADALPHDATRAVSPITAVVVVRSGIAGVSPFAVVKRTAIPMAVGFRCEYDCHNHAILFSH
ncbi:hypothetical protein ACNKHU_19960 [Shigella flexneri]